MEENFNLSYKELHEMFMENHNGTSLQETLIIQSPIPFAIFLSVYIVKNIDRFFKKKTFYISFLLFIIEFIVLVVSQILLFTIPDYKFYINLLLYCSSCYIFVIICLGYMKETIVAKKSTISLIQTQLGGKRPYITFFRTSVNLTTTICILAVDFVSFPRSLAKTESFGFSLMDTGVGYFVVCNGLVGSHVFKCNAGRNVRINLLGKQLKQNSILIALGLLRLLSTKSVDYQNHYSEYGVHWNFFLTLALTRFIASLTLSYIEINEVKYLAFIIMVLHQVILSSGIQNWVVSDVPRDNMVTANREGIFSLLGYIVLYFIAVDIGNKLNLKLTSFGQDLKLLLKLFFSTILLYGFVVILNNYFKCSRRLANITFISWIIMLVLFLLTLCLLFELLLRLTNGPKNLSDDCNIVPSILLSINYNALPYFLICNVLTGVINLSLETLYVSKIVSIIILVLYMFIACSVVKLLYLNKLNLF
ncbi:uncharacterized protein LOC142318823 [Lycorma delicatula]|uniref:uncharacterized protein LOC142318823 n=1 Tax=Lycorma delicatula TaxID=130591 RepID=UPI003F516261